MYVDEASLPRDHSKRSQKGLMKIIRNSRIALFLFVTVSIASLAAPIARAQQQQPTQQSKSAGASAGAQPSEDTATDQAAAKSDKFPPQIRKAYEFANAGKFDDSVKEFKNYLKNENEQCADCYKGLGKVYLMQNKNKEAVASFRRAIELKSSDEAQLYMLLGVAFYRQGDKKQLPEAVAAFQRSIDLSKGQMRQAYYNLGYAFFKLGKKEEGAAALTTYLEKEPAAKNAFQIRAIIKDPRLVDSPFAVPFSVTTNSGEKVSLESLRGKVVLLDFWASWCMPCQQEMPNVRRVWKKYAGDNFVLLGVSLDSDAEHYESFLKKEKMEWPQYFDNKGWANSLARLYVVQSIPRAILIDQDGFIQATNLRGNDLARKVEELLKKRRVN